MFLGYDRCKQNISTISAFKALIIKLVGEEGVGKTQTNQGRLNQSNTEIFLNIIICIINEHNNNSKMGNINAILRSRRKRHGE